MDWKFDRQWTRDSDLDRFAMHVRILNVKAVDMSINQADRSDVASGNTVATENGERIDSITIL